MADHETEEFREEILDALHCIQRSLESISASLNAMPHNIAYQMGYKPFPAVPSVKPKTPSIADEN